MQICSKFLDLISDFEKKIEIQIESNTKSDVVYDVTVYPWMLENSICDCEGYKFRHKCSHIEQVYNHYFCDWSEAEAKEKQDNEQRSKHICPKCGSDTRDI